MELAARLEGPSAAHPMGTDQYGRDLLSRVMRGAVASLAVGAVAVGIGMGVGVVLGAAGGWVGGWLDEAAMRLTDAVYGFPAVLSALLVTRCSARACSSAWSPSASRTCRSSRGSRGRASSRSGPRSSSRPRARSGRGTALILGGTSCPTRCRR